jgi:hypothetical protein
MGKGFYIKELGFFFFLRIAVAVSSSYGLLVSVQAKVYCRAVQPTSLCSAPEPSLVSPLAIWIAKTERKSAVDVLEVDSLLLVGVIRLGGHREGSEICDVDESGAWGK